jgi:hypothetical protein
VRDTTEEEKMSDINRDGRSDASYGVNTDTRSDAGDSQSPLAHRGGSADFESKRDVQLGIDSRDETENDRAFDRGLSPSASLNQGVDGITY